LQNSRLLEYLDSFRAAGVRAACNASPLASGLLRKGGVPVGTLGDWHPAPSGLRQKAAQAADWVEQECDGNGRPLAELALQYAVIRSLRGSKPGFAVSTITGISTMDDLEQNAVAVGKILNGPHDGELKDRIPDPGIGLLGSRELNSKAASAAEPLFLGIQRILGDWVGYDFSSTPPSSSKGPDEQVVEIVTSLNGAEDMRS
jgi:D-arabinose 1-dehydrogenase